MWVKIGFEITQEAAETIQFRRKVVEAPPGCKSDYDIVSELAARLGLREHFFGCSIEAAWTHQLEPLGLTLDTLRQNPTGIRIPQKFSARKFAQLEQNGAVRGFSTETRRAELYSEKMHRHGYDPIPRFDGGLTQASQTNDSFPLLLTTAKSGWFTHSSYRHVASLRRRNLEPSADIHPVLAERHDLTSGDWMIVETTAGSVRLKTRLNSSLDPRVVIAEFGWWEGCQALGLPGYAVVGPQASNVNAVLTDDAHDPVSGSVPLRGVACNIRRDSEANVGRWAGRKDFRIVSKRMVSDEVASFEFRPLAGDGRPIFRPGQHVIVHDKYTELARAYSLTSSAIDDSDLSVAVRCDPRKSPDGSLSYRLHQMKPGDVVSLEQPNGLFSPPARSTRPVVLLAGGIGVTPFISYLKTVAALPAQERPPSIMFCTSYRSGEYRLFSDEIVELKSRIENLRVVVFYSRPGSNDRLGIDFDFPGRVDFSLLRIGDLQKPLIYICGTEEFARDLSLAATKLDIDKFDIFFEAFSPPKAAPSKLVPRKIVLAGSGEEFEWAPSSGSILEAAQKAKVTLPSGCRAGQCESCRVEVIEGSFAHLVDYQGDGCLTCQAVPLTDLIIREFG